MDLVLLGKFGTRKYSIRWIMKESASFGVGIREKTDNKQLGNSHHT